MYVCMYVSRYVCMYIRMYVCMYVYILGTGVCDVANDSFRGFEIIAEHRAVSAN